VSTDEVPFTGLAKSDKPLTIYHSGVFSGVLSQFMKTIGMLCGRARAERAQRESPTGAHRR
jgi:hypothetical protein